MISTSKGTDKIRSGFFTWSRLLLAAISVGWLIGLSTSPVLHVIVGSVIAVVVAVVGALSGIKTQLSVADEEPKGDPATRVSAVSGLSVNPTPVVVFAVGLAIGATIGIAARTNELFSPNKGMFVRRWQGIGLTDVEIKRRLFDQLYPPVPDRGEARDRNVDKGRSDSRGQADEHNPRAAALTAALFAASVEDCPWTRVSVRGEILGFLCRRATAQSDHQPQPGVAVAPPSGHGTE